MSWCLPLHQSMNTLKRRSVWRITVTINFRYQDSLSLLPSPARTRAPHPCPEPSDFQGELERGGCHWAKDDGIVLAGAVKN